MKSIKRYLFLLSILCSGLVQFLHAQDMEPVVQRCKALDQNSPIHNIWVDEENIKWVANSQGLFKVLALDLALKVSVPSGKTSLLDIRGGNAQLEWNTSEMKSILGNVTVTCASYDPKSKTVWIGTLERGAFQFNPDPLRLVQQINTDNKRLASNRINDIFIQASGKTWIATDDGMLTGSGDKWTLEERYLNFIGVDAYDQNLWILGDDFLWQVDSKGKWKSIAIEPKNVEGQLRDIAVDDKGRIWIASNMMTGYDVNAMRYQRFGPGQYFTSQFVNCLDVDQDGSIWTGTDDKGLYLIQWEAGLIVNISMDAPLDCKTKANTAILSALVRGGDEPYSYKWSNGQTALKMNLLGPGHYILTVTDAKGMVKIAKYEIPDPNLHIKTEIVSASSGNPNGDGSANLLVNGGLSPLTYAWDNGETRQTAIKLTAGEHAVTVTDASGCSSTAVVTISEKILPLGVFAKFLSENKCADANDGIAEVEVSGGKGPFQYKWSAGSQSTAKITGLKAGLYTVTVTDSKGASTSTSVNIPAPAPLQLKADLIAAAAVNTSNGIAEAKALGGRPPYSFQWDNNDVNAKATSLNAGTHSVTVTDGNGCTATAQVVMNENINALGAIIKQPVRISCHGAGGAALKVDISGGKPPYTYQWNDGQTAAMAEKLMAGTYSVTVTDASGKSLNSSFTISEPAIMVSSTSVDVNATPNNADGKASVKVSGGSGTFQYAWDNGEKANQAVKLPAGKHVVTVTDGTGCATTAEVNVGENISAMQVEIEQTDKVKCAGTSEGKINAKVSGGKSPYTYQWSNNQTTAAIDNLGDGLYKLTITDASGQTATSVITVFSPPALAVQAKTILSASTSKSDGKASVTVTGGSGSYTYKWDNGESTANAVALSAGKHMVTVTDENGCATTSEVNIIENILPIAVRITQGDKINCTGNESASLLTQVTGGKAPYTYNWKGKSKTYTGETISGLGAGQYSLDVTDASGLSGRAEIEIIEPKPIELSIVDIIPATTNNEDGKVTLRATGGTSSYTVDGTKIQSGVNSITIDRLKPGEHLLIVNDAAGCSAKIKVTIPENVLPLTTTIQQKNDVLCAGNTDATLEAIVKGGKAPVSYAWSTGSTATSITNIKAGEYTLTVTDAAGQTNKTEFSVKQPVAIKLTISNMRSATNDRIKDGKANVETVGGSGSFTFQWSSGETNHQAVALPLGPGYVIATDQNGCSAKAEFTINQKVLPELTTDRLSSGEPIRMEKIQFAADSINVNDEAKPSLDELYEFLYDNPTMIIEVSGHTNGLPADEYCDKISSARAQSVANYIVSKGIESRRVISKGYGKRKPIAPNQTPEGRKKNQRVEIRLIKIGE